MITLQQKQELEEALAEARRDVMDLAYAVSHDITAPARHIRSFTKLALRSLDDEPETARQHLELVLKGSEQLRLMLDAVLLFSRVGRSEAPWEDLSVGQLVAAAIAEHDELLDANGTSIECDRDMVIRGDPGQLAYLFQEAIGNIAHHAGDGVRARIVASEDESHWLLDFIDDGVGIPHAKFDDALQLFRKVTHTGPSHVSAGLGLVRRIARHHGGTAALLPAEGTHLRITIARTGEP